MTAKDYDTVKDGEWYSTPLGEKFMLICCECSLTHWVEFDKGPKGRTRWRLMRDDKQTKRNRRRFRVTAAAIE